MKPKCPNCGDEMRVIGMHNGPLWACKTCCIEKAKEPAESYNDGPLSLGDGRDRS